MPQQLENVLVSSANFTDATTALFQLPTYRITLVLGNQAVFYQLLTVPRGLKASAGAWKQPDEFLIPGAGDIVRPFLMGGIRFRLGDPFGGIIASITARPT